ncbi:MAG: DMT family transporter [Bifidobacteriaceae bacterium]|nr:DMT family transporter [Bifidobacteriaceae bacterium]
MEFVALAVALAAAVCFAGAFVSQQHVAFAVPEAKGRGLRLYLQLARSPIWWAGAVGDVAGFALQAVALGFGSVVLVQPVLVTAMVFALPLAAWWNGRRIRRSDLAWAVLVVVGLAVFTTVANTEKGTVSDAARPWLFPGITIGLVLAGLWLAGIKSKGTMRAFSYGALAGVAYGVIAPLTELSVVNLEQLGLLGLVKSWPLYALVVFMLVGTALQQAAFHAGDLGASLPATQVLEPLVAVALGFWALGAQLHTSLVGWVAIAAAGAAMAVGTVQLARSAAK